LATGKKQIQDMAQNQSNYDLEYNDKKIILKNVYF